MSEALARQGFSALRRTFLSAWPRHRRRAALHLFAPPSRFEDGKWAETGCGPEPDAAAARRRRCVVRVESAFAPRRAAPRAAPDRADQNALYGGCGLRGADRAQAGAGAPPSAEAPPAARALAGRGGGRVFFGRHRGGSRTTPCAPAHGAAIGQGGDRVARRDAPPSLEGRGANTEKFEPSVSPRADASALSAGL